MKGLRNWFEYAETLDSFGREAEEAPQGAREEARLSHALSGEHAKARKSVASIVASI